MTTSNTPEKVYVVRLPNGDLYIAPDARRDHPEAAWIHSRFVAEMVADQVGGKVEVL
jgi:hypothetical protein